MTLGEEERAQHVDAREGIGQAGETARCLAAQNVETPRLLLDVEIGVLLGRDEERGLDDVERVALDIWSRRRARASSA